MRHRISWCLMFRVKDLRKAQVRVEKVREAFGTEVEVRSCNQYWKLPELWDCQLETGEMDKPIPEAICDCLLLAGKIGNGWFLLGPLIKDGVLVVFKGVFGTQNSGTPYIAGFEWGSFSIIPQHS